MAPQMRETSRASCSPVAYKFCGPAGTRSKSGAVGVMMLGARQMRNRGRWWRWAMGVQDSSLM